MTDFNLFGDIDLVDDALHPPLAGVPVAALKSISWSTVNLAKIGQPPAQNRKGWRDELIIRRSLGEIRSREERPVTEYLISATINGELRTGTGALPHNELVGILEEQGYILTRADDLKGFLIERFDRRV
jgi:hypothetical protein